MKALRSRPSPARAGKTRRIDDLLRAAAADPRVIGLAGGLPSSMLFPRSGLERAFLRAMNRAGVPGLQYGWAEGTPALRAFVAGRLATRGAPAAPDEIIVTSGAQQAIAIALQLAAPRGAPVAIDDETYPALLDLLRARGLQPVPIGTRAPCAYVMPALGNPSGRGASPSQRRALVDGDAVIIEDDAYADLRFAGPPPPSLRADAPGRVFHVGSLSKVLCPGLRIGWLVPPRSMHAQSLALKQNADLQASSLGQAIVEQFLVGDGRRFDFDARLVRLRAFYQRRAEGLALALRRHLPTWRFAFPEGGFGIWASTESRTDEVAFLDAAVAEGVSFDVGSRFRAEPAGARGERATALRVCFSSAPPDKIDEGVRRLARAFHKTARRISARTQR